MMDENLENGTAMSVGGATTAITLDTEDEYHVHDQLPSVEEYKTHMAEGTTSTARREEADGDEDDEEQAVHDQLPSVEEIKATVAVTTAATPREKTTYGRECIRVLALIVVFLAVVVAITVPAVVLTQNKEKSSRSSTRASRRTEVVEYLANADISSADRLDLPGTPQFKAAEWIADQDGLNLPIPHDDDKNNAFVERFALAVLYFATDGQNWEHQMNFLEPIEACSWHTTFITTSGDFVRLGVHSCGTSGDANGNALGKHVVRLGLPFNNLVGEIPDEIQVLHRLEVLSVPYNIGLAGDLKFGLVKLASLESLELQYCSLTGPIPAWLGSIRRLKRLELGNNLLTGAVPDTLFQLTNLQLLALDDNVGVTGKVQDFGALGNLNSLYLEDNAFTGTLTSGAFSDWSNMIELDLSRNMIDSTLPSNFFLMKDLEVLDVSGNMLHGPIPEVPLKNTQLRFLALHENMLNSTIPDSISNLPLLAHLDLSRNALKSPLPASIGQLERLRYLFIGTNPFNTQLFPAFVTQLTLLRELSMKDSNLIGGIPSDIANLKALQLLDLDRNGLSGAIPEEIGHLSNLAFVLLNRNRFSGVLPQSVKLMHSLDIFLIDGNNITGNADVVCKDDSVNPSLFVSDCGGPNPPISCNCCDLCCDPGNVTCNNYDWHVNLDPIWEYGYNRVVYQFGQTLLESADEP